jgi:3-oxoacyl-[acyl-carrier-protein] synthase III
MRILSIEHAVPSHEITNAWVLDQLRAHNASRFSAEQLALLERRVSRFLEGAGTKIRYGLASGERAIDLALAASREALLTSNVAPTDVDLLLYVGVCRGWTEPAMANAVQHALGLSNATCFDILDACASWLRALQVAHAYLSNGTYRCAMIVNCECAFVPYRDWELDSLEELEHRVAGWTAGEAATATIIGSGGTPDDFYFTFKNFGEHYGLCMFPLAMVEDFTVTPSDGRYAPMRFFALSRELLKVSVEKVVEVFQSDPHLPKQRYDIGFGHEASKKVNGIIARRLGLPYEGYYETHERFGNTVSASVPLAMSLAIDDGKLQRGHRVLVLVGASGITVGLASFTF